MKKLLLIIVLFVVPSIIFSQVLTQHFAKGEAVKNGVKVRKGMTSKIIEMPSVDVEKLLKEDAEMAGEDIPYRFGYGFETLYTLDDGEWEDDDEGRLWSLRFKSNGAVSLNFVFEDFSLPDGAYLNIVNSDETIVYGPVTSDNIPQDKFFLTDVIPDSSVTIYLWEPYSQIGRSFLTIKKVVHGYQNCYNINDDEYGCPGYSDPCNIPVENGFPNYENESNAVALILLEDGTCWCSGSLILSTDMSFKPYLLTAFHCVNTETYPSNVPTDMVASSAEKENVNHWAIKFGFRQQSNYTITFNGAVFRAGWFDSDFALVELYENVKKFSHLTWLGWDRTGNVPSSGVGIHHPKGDYMKISIDDDPSQNSMWVESLYSNNVTQHWLEHWDTGIIQKGSSGSPLLNESKRVVGQLHGVKFEGDHTINTFLYSPCLIDYASYGKISLSWTGGGTNDTRLSNWLDPNNTGQTTLDSRNPPYILGPSLLTDTCNYYVANLPSGYSVVWSYVKNSGYNITFQANVPQTNYCRLINSPLNRIDITLTADVYNGSTLVLSITKDASYYPPTIGTYSQHDTYNASQIWEIPETNVYEGESLELRSKCTIYIYSNLFVGANVTYSGDSPESWSNDNNGTITLRYPYSANTWKYSTIIATLYGQQVCQIPLHIHPINEMPPIDPILLLELYDNSLTIAITDKNAPDADRGVIHDNDQYIIWYLTISNLVTGRQMFNGTIDELSTIINTTNWPSGAYAIQAQIGNKIVVQKQVLK